MQKTLLITIDFPPMFGGVANYWANLAKNLVCDNLVVLASEYNNSLDFDIKQNYLIYRKNLISKNKWLWPKWLPLLYYTFKLVRQEKIKKIIVAHVLPTGIVALILKKLLNISYVVSVHGLDIALARSIKRKSWIMKKIIQNADTVIANSNYSLELLKTSCKVELNSFEIVYPCPNIVDDKLIVDEREINNLKQKYNLQNKKIILTVGRLVKRKGHDKVIESLPIILEKIPNAVYVMVGNGGYYNKLKQKIVDLNLDSKVENYNDILDKELADFYRMADVFVMPSRLLDNGDVEGFGIVYLEANLFCKPAIAGRVGGAVEAVEDNLTGLLVDPNNVNEIAEAIIDFLSDEQKAKQFGENGRQRVLHEFTWAKQAQKLVKILN